MRRKEAARSLLIQTENHEELKNETEHIQAKTVCVKIKTHK